MAGVTGFMIVSESNMSFEERTRHFAGVTSSIQTKNLLLGLYYKISLNDRSNNGHEALRLDNITGLYLSTSLIAYLNGEEPTRYLEFDVPKIT